jgi:hypothetical protein
MEPDSHEDVLSMYSTKTKMLIRHIMRSDGRQIEIERRVKEIAVAIDRRNAEQAGKARGLWQSIWKAAGVLKAEGDKLFK